MISNMFMLIVGRAVKLSLSHYSLVVAAQDLADQIEVLLQGVRIAPEPSYEVSVKTVGDVQPQSVYVKIVNPEPDRVENMRDDFLISEIELYQVVIAFPALVPETVVVRGISVEADIEPVLVRRFPSPMQNILKLRETAADMIEHAVQDHADPRCVKVFADLLEILVGAQSAVDLLVVPRVIAVRIRLKGRAYPTQRQDKSRPQ